MAREGRALRGTDLSCPGWGVVALCHDPLAARSCLSCVLTAQLCLHNCLSVCAVSRMKRWGGGRSSSAIFLCSRGAGTAEVWSALAGVGRLATGAVRCQSPVPKQWPEQKKAVITLRRERSWPGENAGELILGGCDGKSPL